MARIPIEMPALGYDMEQARVLSWLKEVGDDVARGDVLAEIETEKSTVEVETHAAGRLVEIVHDSGDEVPAGETIGFLEDGAG